MERIASWLEDKYTGESPGSSRFERTVGEYHASQIGKCTRQTYYKFTQDVPDDWSPYFELGHRFESIYGGALRHQYGSDRVVQDVTCEIHISDRIKITGESDWVVLEAGTATPTHVELFEDGTRRVEYRDRPEAHIDNGTPIMRVVETKTTRKIEWKEKYGYNDDHKYQLGVYMWAFDAPGEIAYMTRNELDEMVFEFERDDTFESDIELRARTLDMKLRDEVLPETDPPRDGICKYCDFRDVCKKEGGNRWS